MRTESFRCQDAFFDIKTLPPTHQSWQIYAPLMYMSPSHFLSLSFLSIFQILLVSFSQFLDSLQLILGEFWFVFGRVLVVFVAGFGPNTNKWQQVFAPLFCRFLPGFLLRFFWQIFGHCSAYIAAFSTQSHSKNARCIFKQNDLG